MFPQSMLEYTDEVCAREPLAAHTRARLWRLEAQAHRAGWDSDDALPRVFELQYHVRSGQVLHHWFDGFTELILEAFGANGQHLGPAVMWLADGIERIMDGEFDQVADPAIIAKLQRFRRPFEDTYDGVRPGWKLYGFGIRFEGWLVREKHENVEDARRNADPRTPRERPDRMECRMVNFAARDGLLWTLHRIRGHVAEAIVVRPESDQKFVGPVVHGLGRLTNALVNNPVPVRPARNPLFQYRDGC